MRSLAIAVALACALLTTLSAQAGAARPATAEEAAAMAAAIDQAEFREPDCTQATISTVAPDWGVLAVATDCTGGAPLVAVLRRAGDSWELRDTSVLWSRKVACELMRIPQQMAADLGLCSPGADVRLLPCVRPGSSDVALTRRPTRCGDRRGSHNTNWGVRGIRWNRWTPREAIGRGTLPPDHYQGKDDPGRPVHLRASGIAWWCGAARPIYTRLRIWAKPTRVSYTPWGSSRRQRFRLPAYEQTVTLPVPGGCNFNAYLDE